MKKTLLFLTVLALTMPVMAETSTTVTKQFVPFTEAIDRAKLQQEADSNYAIQSLQKQRAEVQTKINTKKEAYEKQQVEQAKKRAELKKQNDAKRQEIENTIGTTKKNMQNSINSTREGVQTVRRNVVEAPEQIRKNNAEIFTNLKNSVNEVNE